MSKAPISFHDLRPTAADLAADVLAGFSRAQESIPPKYFYDAEGSRLFDAITELPEYYPTRTETAMLHEYADEIAKKAGTGHLLVEPGSGSCSKARILFEGLQPCAYVPMDISRDHLRVAAQEVAIDFPWLEVHAACTDFTRLMTLPPNSPEGRRLAQQVSLQGQNFRFAGGETIHTENSYKYSVVEFRDLASQAGFSTDTVWVDADRLFSLHLLQTGEADAD